MVNEDLDLEGTDDDGDDVRYKVNKGIRVGKVKTAIKKRAPKKKLSRTEAAKLVRDKKYGPIGTPSWRKTGQVEGAMVTD